MAEHWAAHGNSATYQALYGQDHFSVLAMLTADHGPLAEQALAFIRGPASGAGHPNMGAPTAQPPRPALVRYCRSSSPISRAARRTGSTSRTLASVMRPCVVATVTAASSRPLSLCTGRPTALMPGTARLAINA